MIFDDLLNLIQDDPVFESSILFAGDVDPKAIRVQLSRWVKSGKIVQLRRGLYALAPPYQKIKPHPFFIANRLQKASYISLQTALSYYNLIPEFVQTVTSVSTGRTEQLSTPLGSFSFRHIKTEFFFGYKTVDLPNQLVFIAEAEKAILDMVYLQAGGDNPAFLEELRLQHLNFLDVKKLQDFAQRFNSPKMTRASQIILTLIEREKKEYQAL
jgi:predicted transcriptional regulator of viral defense system